MKLKKFLSEYSKKLFSDHKGEKVCEVTKHSLNRKVIFGLPTPYIQWKGSTEENYFLTTFYGGMILMEVEEREIRLGTNTGILIALSPKVSYLIDHMENEEELLSFVPQHSTYLHDDYPKEIATIKFSDIMKLFGWKYQSRKIREQEEFF